MAKIPPTPHMTLLDEEWINWAADTYALRPEMVRGMLAGYYLMHARRYSDGIALQSAEHPKGAPVAEDADISPEALETVEVMLPDPKTCAELIAAVEQLFDCRMGEPSALTRDPPGDINGDDAVYAYHVFGYAGEGATEEQLVAALWAEFKNWSAHIDAWCSRAKLYWRRSEKIELQLIPAHDPMMNPFTGEVFSGHEGGGIISTRLCIPRLGNRLADSPAYKPEGGCYPLLEGAC